MPIKFWRKQIINKYHELYYRYLKILRERYVSHDRRKRRRKNIVTIYLFLKAYKSWQSRNE